MVRRPVASWTLGLAVIALSCLTIAYVFQAASKSNIQLINRANIADTLRPIISATTKSVVTEILEPKLADVRKPPGPELPENIVSTDHPSEHRKPSCWVDVDKVLSRVSKFTGKPKEETYESCRARVKSGDNVVLEQLLHYVKDWDMVHDEHFFCNLIQGPRSNSYSSWPEVDFTYKRSDIFDWKDFVNVEGTKVLHFKEGKSYCKLFEFEKFKQFAPAVKLIILGPFGDGSNFGPFSGGPHAPYFKFKTFEHVMHMLCGVSIDQALRFLEDDRVLAWISFQQNLEHPKIMSMTIGTSREFITNAVTNQALVDSMGLKKEKLVGVTFSRGYADRNDWLDSVNRSLKLLGDQVEYSKINPFHNKTIAKEVAWKLALETPRRSKVVISPGGLGIDTKRPAEALLVGSVPLLLISTGMYKTYNHLPILWVFSYDEYYALEHRLVNLLCTGRTFNFGKLTYEGWRDLIRGLKAGTIRLDEW